LPAPVRGQRRRPGRPPRPGREPVAAHLPVTLRPRAVAGPGHRRKRAPPGRRGGEDAGRGLPGLFRRLPGNAGGDRDAERRDLPRRRRRGAALHPGAQRRPRPRRRPGGAGAAAPARLAAGVIGEIELPAARGRLTALAGGRANGPPLLCLHGWLDNAASFQPLAPWLAGFRWVALDLPGHGGSGHRASGHDYAFVDWLHDVLDALDALGWERADLLGHSMGGAIASLLAAAVPERVRRLALIEALGPLAGDPDQAGPRLREAVQARRRLRPRPPRRIPDIDTAVNARLAATKMERDAARRIVERNLQPFEGGYAWRSDPRLTLPAATRMPEAAVRSM